MALEAVNNDAEMNLYSVESGDPESELIDRSAMSEADIGQIDLMMASMARLRKAEDELSDASNKYMKLNKTDMKALRFLIVCKHRGELVTPGDMSVHLGITTASTTKLLDRLEEAGHVKRKPHPSDRRALVVEISPKTHRSAMDTVGKAQAKRFTVAAQRTSKERDIITSFLNDLAANLAVNEEDWNSRP